MISFAFIIGMVALFGIMVAKFINVWHEIEHAAQVRDIGRRHLEIAEQGCAVNHQENARREELHILQVKSYQKQFENYNENLQKTYWEGYRKGVDRGRAVLKVEEPEVVAVGG